MTITCFASSASAAESRLREEKLLLHIHGIVLRANPFQVAGSGMALAALALAVEVGLAGLRVARQHVLRMEERRSPHRVGHLQVKEMRQIRDLLVREVSCLAGLSRMVFPEYRANLISVPVVKDNHGSNQIGSVLCAAGARAVARNALRRIDLLAALRGFFIHHVLVGRACLGKQSAPAPAASATCRRTPPARRSLRSKPSGQRRAKRSGHGEAPDAHLH